MISILKSGNLEDKLRFVFKAYDLNDDGFLDKVIFLIVFNYFLIERNFLVIVN